MATTRLCLLLLGIVAATRVAVAEAPIYHYTPPPLGRTVVNERVMIDTASALPLRLPRLGRYYAELILEPADGASDVVMTAPLALDVAIAFKRGERVLERRALAVSFAPDERSKTLFWLEVPNQLPQRTALALEVNLHETSVAQLGSTRLRLQLTRKLDFGSLPLWP